MLLVWFVLLVIILMFETWSKYTEAHPVRVGVNGKGFRDKAFEACIGKIVLLQPPRDTDRRLRRILWRRR